MDRLLYAFCRITVAHLDGVGAEKLAVGGAKACIVLGQYVIREFLAVSTISLEIGQLGNMLGVPFLTYGDIFHF